MVEGFKNTEVGVIPNDWEVKSIRQLADINQNEGKSIPDEFVYIDLESVTKGKLIKRNILKKLNAPSRAQRIVTFNDILFQTVRPYQKNNLYFKEEGNYVASTGYAIIRPKVDSGYLYAQLHTDKFVRTVIDFCTGTSYPAINPNILSTIKIPLPPTKAEQTAIAASLNDADALINQLQQLLTKKRNIKTGAMQELLKPKEGWEVKKLGEVLKVRHGKSQKEVVAENGAYPILASGGVIGRAKLFLYNKPSVLIGRKGTINEPQYMDTPFWSVDTLFYTEINDAYDAKFIFYMFNLIDWYSYNEASGVPSLNAKTIELIEKYFPQSKTEQTRIAELLSDMDNEIQELEKQIEKYKMLKQGMMQSLLTGKIRLV